MSHLLLIFGLGLGAGGFLFWEAHPQAWDEFPGQGAPREGQGQDGQALQCVLTAGPEWHCQVLPGPARASTRSKCVLDAAQGGWEKLLGSFPPGSCWQSRACNSCQPLLQLGTGKAGRERGQQPGPGLQHLQHGRESSQSSRQGQLPASPPRAPLCPTDTCSPSLVPPCPAVTAGRGQGRSSADDEAPIKFG